MDYTRASSNSMSSLFIFQNDFRHPYTFEENLVRNPSRSIRSLATTIPSPIELPWRTKSAPLLGKPIKTLLDMVIWQPIKKPDPDFVNHMKNMYQDMINVWQATGFSERFHRDVQLIVLFSSLAHLLHARDLCFGGRNDKNMLMQCSGPYP